MKKRSYTNILTAFGLLAAFLLWTAAVRRIDVQPIGPGGTSVGFAAMNRFVHDLTGVSMPLYTVTDWLGLVPVLFALGFALLGLTQWIRRGSLWRVDRSIRILGIFYLAVLGAYLFFDRFVINYRPVLIEGRLEASYPSSTTLLVLCVMSTTLLQLRERIRSGILRRVLSVAICGFMAFMVLGRLLSGVHWFTDIIGGAMLSAGLVRLYHAAVSFQSSCRRAVPASHTGPALK